MSIRSVQYLVDASELIRSGQLEVKRTALMESVRRVNNLEKANTTHLQKYAEMSRRGEALEKVSIVWVVLSSSLD